MKPVYLSYADKQTIETVRLYGTVEVFINDWRMFDRLAQTGRIILSEPHGVNNHWKTASMKREGE